MNDKMKPCPECDGTGVDPKSEFWFSCDYCKGTGTVFESTKKAEVWIGVENTTEYWNDPNLLECCQKIYSVHLVDRNRHIFICSLTPSLEAYYLYPDFELKRGYERAEQDYNGVWGSPETYNEMRDSLIDDLDEIVKEGERETPEVNYFDINFPFEWVGNKIQNEFEYNTELEYREKLDELIEYYRCNHVV